MGVVRVNRVAGPRRCIPALRPADDVIGDDDVHPVAERGVDLLRETGQQGGAVHVLPLRGVDADADDLRVPIPGERRVVGDRVVRVRIPVRVVARHERVDHVDAVQVDGLPVGDDFDSGNGEPGRDVRMHAGIADGQRRGCVAGERGDGARGVNHRLDGGNDPRVPRGETARPVLPAKRTDAEDIGVAARQVMIAQGSRAAISPGAFIHGKGRVAQVLNHGDGVGGGVRPPGLRERAGVPVRHRAGRRIPCILRNESQGCAGAAHAGVPIAPQILDDPVVLRSAIGFAVQDNGIAVGRDGCVGAEQIQSPLCLLGDVAAPVAVVGRGDWRNAGVVEPDSQGDVALIDKVRILGGHGGVHRVASLPAGQEHHHRARFPPGNPRRPGGDGPARVKLLGDSGTHRPCRRQGQRNDEKKE